LQGFEGSNTKEEQEYREIGSESEPSHFSLRSLFHKRLPEQDEATHNSAEQ